MVRKYCSVCGGSGKIPNPRGNGKAIYLPEITCPNCNGEGFVGTPGNFPTKESPYKTQLNKVQKR